MCTTGFEGHARKGTMQRVSELWGLRQPGQAAGLAVYVS